MLKAIFAGSIYNSMNSLRHSHNYVLLLGSNLGDSLDMLKKSSEHILLSVGEIKAKSKIYSSEPWGFDAPTLFLNQALLVSSQHSPWELLQEIHSIERKLGRVRSEEKNYTSRIIDIDILHWDGAPVETEELSIPHKLLHLRRFALLPMCELVGEVLHPSIRLSYNLILENCLDHGVLTELPLR
jgi:2-amino-4-hydroxy-6-hydroxymethyldihydropteridine diphosphokinase